jgi:tRNA 2-thiouridine synthesizing protein A
MTDTTPPDLIPADAALDIRRDICPMTFVRTRLALDRLATGQILRVHLAGAEPIANVPRTAQEQGHALLHSQPQPDGSLILWLRRG